MCVYRVNYVCSYIIRQQNYLNYYENNMTKHAKC